MRPTPRPLTLADAMVFGTSLLICLALALGTPACKGPVFPQIEAVINIVAVDLENGKTDPQIASDVCAALGGTSTTDAVCAGVATLVTDAVQVLLDTGVLSEKAQTRAHALMAHAHAADASPDGSP